MKRFLDDDFLLDSKTAVDLYEEFARRQPIIDYHCHLSPHQIADDHRWRSLTEIWLEGDHYKWRAMRAAGVPERLHHRRRVGLGEVRGLGGGRCRRRCATRSTTGRTWSWRFRSACAASCWAPTPRSEIFEHCNRGWPSREFTAQGLLTQFDVRSSAAPTIPSTTWSRTGATRPTPGAATKLLPTWRPDKALALHDPAVWNEWIDKLAAAADIDIPDLARLRDAIAEAARLLPRARLPRVRSRPGADLRRALHGGARPAQRSPRRARASRCRPSRSRSSAPRSATTSR